MSWRFPRYVVELSSVKMQLIDQIAPTCPKNRNVQSRGEQCRPDLVISVIKFGETLITKKHGEPVGFRIFNALSPSR